MVSQLIALRSVTQRLRESYGIKDPSYTTVMCAEFAKKFKIFSQAGKREFCWLVGGAKNSSFVMKELEKLAQG